jgi:hypothetical protein
MRTEIHGQAAGAIEDEDEVAAQFGNGAEGVGRDELHDGLRVTR